MSKDIVDADHVEVSTELALLRMQNDQIMAMARMAPREPAKIVEELQKLIDAYPAAADEAIYSKPVGTVTQITCSGCKIHFEVASIDGDTECPACGGKKFEGQKRIKKHAEGLSIRAAESIRCVFGYTRLATTTELLPDGRVKLTGLLVDFCAGSMTSDERIVSPHYKNRQGQMVSMSEDRFLDVKVKAEKSKLRRDVILDSVPNIVKACFRDACEQKLKSLVSNELVEQKIVPAFQSYGISREHLDQIVGRPASLGWNETDRLELRKILNGLQSGETTVRELLEGLGSKSGGGQPEPPAEERKGPATMQDLLGGAEKPKAEPPQEKAKAEPPQAEPTEPPACEHKDITWERLNALPKGKKLVCSCGEEFPSPKDGLLEEPEEKKPAPAKARKKPQPLEENSLGLLFMEVGKLYPNDAKRLKAVWDEITEAYDQSSADIRVARAKFEEIKARQ
jgi:DNA-directed RNA polymerase subunit RPC12/RpoP